MTEAKATISQECYFFLMQSHCEGSSSKQQLKRVIISVFFLGLEEPKTAPYSKLPAKKKRFLCVYQKKCD